MEIPDASIDLNLERKCPNDVLSKLARRLSFWLKFGFKDVGLSLRFI